MAITKQIQTFNEAFKVAWDLCVQHSKLSPGIGARLSEAIRRIMKNGASDPIAIAEEAFKSID
jgi:hypothetical protein